MKTVSGSGGVKRRGIYLLADLVVVASFVLIGRDAHNESIGLAEVARTAGPFLLAVTGAWATPLVHRMPWRIGSGVAVGIITTALGLYFRSVVFGEGLSGLFPVITSVYLVGLMTGIRLVAVARSRAMPA